MSLTKYIEQRRIEREREVRRKIRNEKLSSLAKVAAGAAVAAVSGLFKPQPAREPATIAAHNAVLIHLFFMKRVLLLILFSCSHMIFLCFLNTDFIIRVFHVSEYSKFL